MSRSRNKENFAILAHPGVWCCSRRGQCKWKGFVLEAAGLQWGTSERANDEWRKWHKKECGGKLVQLLPPGNTALD